MKTLKGKVISKLGDKTARVSVERMVVHPKYKKRFRMSRDYLVHDEIGVNVGDAVKFVDSKPYSKMKKWKITERIKK